MVDLSAREEYGPDVVLVRPPEGVRPIDKAMSVSTSYGMLPIWSVDLPNPQNLEKLRGKKRFVTGGYAAFQDYYCRLDVSERCAYEIILENMPTKLYVDVDVNRTINPTLSDTVIKSMMDALIHEITTLASEIHGTEMPLTYTILDSSTTSKLSKHIVFDFFIENNYQCGAFMRTVRNRMTHKHENTKGVGDRKENHPYYIWTSEADRSKPKSGETIRVRTFFFDLAVYTLNRNFRIYGSAKRTSAHRPLFEEGSNGVFDWAVYKKCLLQRRFESDAVYRCMESDGSVPESTSDTDYLRPDAPQQQAPKKRARVAAASAAATSDVVVRKRFAPSPNLRDHWATVFPFETLFTHLAPPIPPPYMVEGQVWRRAFSFSDGAETWTRARFFRSAAEMRDATLKKLPATIHVGPVRLMAGNSTLVSDTEAALTEAWQPTLTFDIDIPDYATWRPCCGSARTACAKCWPIAQFAQRAMVAFVDAMGLGKAMCFFSGNKGVHVWVLPNDAATRIAGSDKRKALFKLFNVVPPPKGANRDEYAIPDSKANTSIAFVQTALGDPDHRKELKEFLCTTMEVRDAFMRHTWRHGEASAIVHMLWPRVDANVTLLSSHPLKAPFCVHKNTSRACVWLKDATINPYSDTLDTAVLAKEMH